MCSDKEALTYLNKSHERSTIYKWMQLVVDTSIVHAISIKKGMQQSIVRNRSRALVLYICLIALSCACLEIEPARVYLVMFVFLHVLGLVLTPGLRAGNGTTNDEAHMLGFTFCGRSSRPFRGLKNGVASRGDCFCNMVFCCTQQRTCERHVASKCAAHCVRVFFLSALRKHAYRH